MATDAFNFFPDSMFQMDFISLNIKFLQNLESFIPVVQVSNQSS